MSKGIEYPVVLLQVARLLTIEQAREGPAPSQLWDRKEILHFGYGSIASIYRACSTRNPHLPHQMTVSCHNMTAYAFNLTPTPLLHEIDNCKRTECYHHDGILDALGKLIVH